MNSIDGVMARIREILTRIQEIRDTRGLVQGLGPSAPSNVPAPRPPVDPTMTKTAGSQPAVKTREFRQLLQQALAAESTGIETRSASSSTGLGGPGDPTNLQSVLESVIGTGATPATANPTALQQYQKELLQALRQFAVQKKQGPL